LSIVKLLMAAKLENVDEKNVLVLEILNSFF